MSLAASNSAAATEFLRSAAAFMRMCLERHSDLTHEEIRGGLSVGARLRLVVEADDSNITACRLELAECDGVSVVLTQCDIELSKG